jgi:hypothetical protein
MTEEEFARDLALLQQMYREDKEAAVEWERRGLSAVALRGCLQRTSRRIDELEQCALRDGIPLRRLQIIAAQLDPDIGEHDRLAAELAEIDRQLAPLRADQAYRRQVRFLIGFTIVCVAISAVLFAIAVLVY